MCFSFQFVFSFSLSCNFQFQLSAFFCFGQLEACKVCDSEHISARKEDHCLLLRAPYSYFIQNCIQAAVNIMTILSKGHFVNNSLVSKNLARFFLWHYNKQRTNTHFFHFWSNPDTGIWICADASAFQISVCFYIIIITTVDFMCDKLLCLSLTFRPSAPWLNTSLGCFTCR